MMSNTARIAAILAVFIAGSCTEMNDGTDLHADGAYNHPITVEPATKSLTVSFAPGDAGLMPEDSLRFDQFVHGYLAGGGTGAMNVSVPDGPGSSEAIQYFGERLASAGIPRARIMVGTHQGVVGRVELGYIAYTAKTDDCGDWSENAGDTLSNLPMANFGCSVQHNIAAQIDDPQDLLQPRALGPADPVRRNGEIDKYQKGQVTQADKNKSDKVNEQSGSESDVGH